MALIFKEEYGITEFCALVATRESYEFLTAQKDIHYSSLLLDEDLHASYVDETLDYEFLRTLEKEYGVPNLWPYLMSDRILMKGQYLREYPYNECNYSHEDLLRLIQSNARGILEFLEREKPDVIYFSVVGNLASHLLYEIARKKGTQVFVGELGRFPNQYMLYSNYKEFNEVNERFSELSSGRQEQNPALLQEARTLIETFRESPQPYAQSDSILKQDMSRASHLRFLLPHRLIKALYWFYRTCVDYYAHDHTHNYTAISPWFYCIDRIKRKFRVMRGFSDLYDAADYSENFVYFPLHYEPEISLFLYAPFATDQLHIIKNVARSVPVGYKVYVKEHPTMVGFRPRSYYKELKKMPNVKLIPPTTVSFGLIQHAKLVTTITGTAGWEALLLKKPSVTFGYNFYNGIPMTAHCSSMETLADTLHNQLNNWGYDEQQLILFISAILERTAHIDLVHLWHDSPDIPEMKKGIQPLVELIARLLTLPALKEK